MIALDTYLGRLDLAPAAIGIECLNPLFSFETVPGTTTYPFQVPMTPGNLRRLNFPHVRAAQGQQPAPEPVHFYIDELLWRVGSLLYGGVDEEKQQLLYNFVADAADLQARIEGLSLPTMDLGMVPFSTTVLDDYVLAPHRNTLFYGDKDKNPAYQGVVNYFRHGAYPGPGPLVPFLRLIPLLRRILATVGYSLSGSWLDEPEAQQLVVYSDRRHDPALATLSVNRHVPDLSPGDVLVALQKYLALGYSFHPVRRELIITSLRDVVAAPAYVDRAGGLARVTAATAGGYLLRQGLEESELNKTLDTSWTQLRVGGGKTLVDTAAGTLMMVREPDPVEPTRSWLVPAVEAAGATSEFELGDESKCGLRLLLDYGLQPGSDGEVYPLVSSGRVNYDGSPLGGLELIWGGPQGLYQQRHQAWLEMLDQAGQEERSMQFRVADLLTLEPARKEMVGHRKYLWQKVSLSVAVDKPLQQARFTYRNTRL